MPEATSPLTAMKLSPEAAYDLAESESDIAEACRQLNELKQGTYTPPPWPDWLTLKPPHPLIQMAQERQRLHEILYVLACRKQALLEGRTPGYHTATVIK